MICKEADCPGNMLARGLCSLHYQRLEAKGPLPPIVRPTRECAVNDCPITFFAGLNIYCKRHLWQVQHHGKILIPGESRCGPTPKAILAKTYAKIILRNDNNKYAIIDKDYVWLEKYKWSKTPHGYVKSTIKGKPTYMHHLALPSKKGWDVDHKNRNKLDNSGLSIANRSGVKGVCWDSSKNSYRAYIGGVSSKNKNNRKELGHYKNFTDAVVARKKAEREYFGDV